MQVNMAHFLLTQEIRAAEAANTARSMGQKEVARLKKQRRRLMQQKHHVLEDGEEQQGHPTVAREVVSLASLVGEPLFCLFFIKCVREPGSSTAQPHNDLFQDLHCSCTSLCAICHSMFCTGALLLQACT